MIESLGGRSSSHQRWSQNRKERKNERKVKNEDHQPKSPIYPTDTARNPERSRSRREVALVRSVGLSRRRRRRTYDRGRTRFQNHFPSTKICALDIIDDPPTADLPHAGLHHAAPFATGAEVADLAASRDPQSSGMIVICELNEGENDPRSKKGLDHALQWMIPGSLVCSSSRRKRKDANGAPESVNFRMNKLIMITGFESMVQHCQTLDLFTARNPCIPVVVLDHSHLDVDPLDLLKI